MSEDTNNILKQTWVRSIDPVVKIGYMDGASDGQTAVFQESFNVSYEQGITFGLELGFREAISRMHHQADLPRPQDKHKINCQICTNDVKAQENIGNLYNIQKEKNSEYLRSYAHVMTSD